VRSPAPPVGQSPLDRYGVADQRSPGRSAWIGDEDVDGNHQDYDDSENDETIGQVRVALRPLPDLRAEPARCVTEERESPSASVLGLPTSNGALTNELEAAREYFGAIVRFQLSSEHCGHPLGGVTSSKCGAARWCSPAPARPALAVHRARQIVQTVL